MMSIHSPTTFESIQVFVQWHPIWSWLIALFVILGVRATLMFFFGVDALLIELRKLNKKLDGHIKAGPKH